MSIKKRIIFNINQITAITEKNIKLEMRFKLVLIMQYITPLIALIMPLIIMGKIFSYQENFGPWNSYNYLVYIFIGYNLIRISSVTGTIAGNLRGEKIMKTLRGLMVAPFNRFNLLFGYILTHLILISIPFAIFFIICYIIVPISIITLIAILFLFLAILLTFAGIGLIIGVFSISNENIARILNFMIQMIFAFSCMSFPYQIFPNYIQTIINYNPLYYVIDLLRLTWIEDDIILTIILHPFHFLIVIFMMLFFPAIGIYMFKYIFNKFGIVGY